MMKYKEMYVSKVSDPNDEFVFWTYFIVHERSAGKRDRFNLFRIDQHMERIERLGCELTLGHCRKIVQKIDRSIVTLKGR